MSNLAKVVQQLRQERDQAQKRIQQLDESLQSQIHRIQIWQQLPASARLPSRRQLRHP